MTGRPVGNMLGLIGAWLMTTLACAAPAAKVPAPQSSAASSFPMARMMLDDLPLDVRHRARKVIEQPTLCARGPAEAFLCRPSVYYWLLDHPDEASRLWRCLGAVPTMIDSEGDGRFRWRDPQAGEIHWETVVAARGQRVWFAQGQVKPAAFLPATAVQALIILQYEEGSDADGKPAVRHQMDLMLHTDSRALALAARLFGGSAPRLAEQYVGQMEMFFGALAWYLSDDPDRARALFAKARRFAGSAPEMRTTPRPFAPAGR